MTEPALPGERLDAAIAETARAFPAIAAMWLFGSVARGDARPDSDLDVGVVFRRRGDTALDHHRMIRTLAARLEQTTGRLIDIVVLESQGPIFRHRVLSEGRLVYDCDPERRVDFESTTYTQYFDFRPTWEIAARHAVAGLRARLEGRR